MVRIDISVFVKDTIKNIPEPFTHEDIKRQVEKYMGRLDYFLIKKGGPSCYELSYEIDGNTLYITSELRDSIDVAYRDAETAESIMEYVSIYAKFLDRYLATAKLRIDGLKWERR